MLKTSFLIILLICFITAAYIPSGLKKISDGRIVGGKDITIEEVPYQVSIRFLGSHICGGSIIRKNVILTAAHCFIYTEVRLFKIRTGSTYRSKDGQIISVIKMKLHEKYEHVTTGYDIGLMWLETDLEFGSSIQPIPLAEKDTKIVDNSTALISGWGVLKPGSDYLPEILQAVNVNVVSPDYCFLMYKGYINPTMICAGFPHIGGIDACQADSGGPFVIENVLVGVVSWGLSCADPSYPGVYANIPELREWIDENLEDDNSV